MIRIRFQLPVLIRREPSECAECRGWPEDGRHELPEDCDGCPDPAAHHAYRESRRLDVQRGYVL